MYHTDANIAPILMFVIENKNSNNKQRFD